jgi:hypothetical protein
VEEDMEVQEEAETLVATGDLVVVVVVVVVVVEQDQNQLK